MGHTLTQQISKSQRVDFVFILLFSFSFLFFFLIYFLFSNLGLGFSDISQSHNHMAQWKTVKGSRRNDVIQHIIYMLTLRKTHGVCYDLSYVLSKRHTLVFE